MFLGVIVLSMAFQTRLGLNFGETILCDQDSSVSALPLTPMQVIEIDTMRNYLSL